jgi:hypothetical protein
MDQVSVVIPSLGSANVINTIKALNQGTLAPEEVLICVPEGTVLDLSDFTNCKIIYCEKRSQVAQRAKGLSIAKNNFVLQLDDDTLLDKNCLENLLDSLKKLSEYSAIAPAILDTATGESIYKNEASSSPFRNLYLLLINGKRKYIPGSVTLVGSSFGPIYAVNEKKILQVESLAGCCVLHRRANLIFDDYFVFKGKAYGEDLIASYLYQEKGITFYVDCSATCFTPSAPLNVSSMRELIKDLRSKHYYLTMSGKLGLNFYIYYFVKIIRELFLGLRFNLFKTLK